MPERVQSGPEQPETEVAGPPVRRLQAETAGLLSLALTDRMQELTHAWKSMTTSDVIREDVGQGLTLSMQVVRKDHARLVEIALYRSEDGTAIGTFQLQDITGGFNLRHRWVDPQWRGGTGAALLRKAEQFAQAVADTERAPRVLTADVGQADVLRFFSRNGYASAVPEDVADIERRLESGGIVTDQSGFMYPRNTPPALQTGRKSLKNLRIFLSKTFNPAPLAPRRRRFGLF